MICLLPALTQVSCSAYFSTLKMEAIWSSETSVDFQRTARCYIPEDGTLQNHRCENLKSYQVDSSSSVFHHSIYALKQRRSLLRCHPRWNTKPLSVWETCNPWHTPTGTCVTRRRRYRHSRDIWRHIQFVLSQLQGRLSRLNRRDRLCFVW
jgi:hypothetical protein